MAALDSVWIVGLLWAAAVAAGVWIIGPAIGFLVYPRRFEVDVDEDPRAAEAHGEDPVYDAKFQQFAALGFVPVGKTVEHARFFTPLHWHWRGHGTRMLVSPDRTTFACFYRLAGANPLRVTLATTFKGGGVLETASPGVGLFVANGNDRRIEVADTDAAAIVERHQCHVQELCEARSLIVERVPLREMAARLMASDQRNVRRPQGAGWYVLFAVCVATSLKAIEHNGLSAEPASLRPAVLCLSALLFVACRWTVLPGRLHRGIRAVITVAVLYLPTFLLWGLPNQLTAEGRQVARLLDRIEADASRGGPVDVDRIVAHGAGVCGAVVKRFAASSPYSTEWAALHQVMVALKGSDLGDYPRAWSGWCLSQRLGRR